MLRIVCTAVRYGKITDSIDVDENNSIFMLVYLIRFNRILHFLYINKDIISCDKRASIDHEKLSQAPQTSLKLYIVWAIYV